MVCVPGVRREKSSTVTMSTSCATTNPVDLAGRCCCAEELCVLGAADISPLDDNFCHTTLELCMETKWSLWCYYGGILLAMTSIVLLVNSIALHHKVRSSLHRIYCTRRVGTLKVYGTIAPLQSLCIERGILHYIALLCHRVNCAVRMFRMFSLPFLGQAADRYPGPPSAYLPAVSSIFLRFILSAYSLPHYRRFC